MSVLDKIGVALGGSEPNFTSRLFSRLKMFLSALGPTAFALVIQLGAFALTARALGVEQFGDYTPLLALASMGVELTGLGGADILVREVARDRTQFRTHYRHMLVLIGISLPVVALILAFIATRLMQTNVAPIIVVLAILGEVLAGRISASVELVMVAHQHTTRASLLRMFTAVSRLVVVLIVFNLLGDYSLADFIEAAFVQSALLSCGYVVLAWHLYSKSLSSGAPPALLSGLPFAVNQVARSAQMTMDRVVLAHFASNEVVGIYGAGSRVLQIGLFPIQVMTRILYPRFFVHGAAGISATRAFALKVAPFMLLVGCLSGIAVAAAAHFAPLVLGKEFQESTQVGTKLAFALPFIALQYPAADALTGVGRQAIRAFVFVVATVSFGLMLSAGASFWGADGMIIAFVGSHALLALVLWGMVLFSRK